MNSSESNPPEGGQPDGQNLWRILQEDTVDAADRAAQREASPETPKGTDSKPLVERKTAQTDRGGITQIERILSDPDSAEFNVDFRSSTRHAETDYDSAVLNFYRDVDAAVTCKNHPNRPSVQQCPECSAYYCQECMVIRRGRMICRDCATAIYVPSEEEIITAQEFGAPTPEADVMPIEHPEFQVGSNALGLEGRPAHPVKRLMALLIDLIVTRGLILILAWIAGGILNHQPGAFFHLFDNQADETTFERIFQAVVLIRPMMPWLILFAIVDFLYFFFSLSFVNRTLGMSWLGCRVVTEWGDFAGFGIIALRTLVFMVCLGWPAVLIGWFFPAYRGPHDYAAGTLVINYSGNKRIDSYDTVQIKLD